VTTLRTFSSNTYDLPVRWSAGAIAALIVVGFSDAPTQGATLLDPTTGARPNHWRSY